MHCINSIAAFCVFLALSACGQQHLELPETTGSGAACGEGYPLSAADGGDNYAIKEGAIFPCLLFESVRLDDQDTYLFFSDIYLCAKHGVDDRVAAVIVVSASNCPACARFMQELNEAADDLDAAGVLMVTALFCDNIARTDCDFTLDRSVTIATGEGWPSDRWFVTNDAEGHLKPAFSNSFPVAIVVRLTDMQVVSVDKTPSADELFDIVQTLD